MTEAVTLIAELGIDGDPIPAPGYVDTGEFPPSPVLEPKVDRFLATVADGAASRVSAQQRADLMASPKFGTVFTDNMARLTWTLEDGWTNPRIEPYGPLELDPATAVLHYGQEVFEGLKAYAHEDGSVWAFRPEANAERMQRSAHRLALPELPVADFLAACAALVRVDRDWVPTAEDSSLYLRPFAYAAEAFLGVRPANVVEFLVIASPAGAYFPSGVRPVSIWVDSEYHRAGPGGTGAAKCGGNYAASLLPQQLAARNGFDQVCFLDAQGSQALEELGGMNIFLVYRDGSVHTPALTGSILEGVTRSSVLQLARDRGREVHERRIELSEVIDGLESGEITEVFACGTAAVITPIGRLAGADFDVTVGDGESGEFTTALRDELTGIQYGRIPDRHGWLVRLA